MNFVDISEQAKYRRGQLNNVSGLVMHHTAGGGTPSGVMNTLNQRGLGVQYVMDRDGQVYQTLPDGARGAHMLPASRFKESANKGLDNSNTIGIEIIAKNNKDLTPAQVKASQQFIGQMQTKYPGIQNNIYGHGELNPGHKEKDEGFAALMPYREAVGAPGTPYKADVAAKHFSTFQAPDSTTPAGPVSTAFSANKPLPADLRAKDGGRPQITEFALPGKGSYALEDGMIVPKETGRAPPIYKDGGALVSPNASVPGQAAGFNANTPLSAALDPKSPIGQIVAQTGSGDTKLGGLVGQMQSLQNGGKPQGPLGLALQGIMNSIITPAYGAGDVPKPLASTPLTSNQPMAPQANQITTPDGQVLNFTPSTNVNPDPGAPTAAPTAPVAPVAPVAAPMAPPAIPTAPEAPMNPAVAPTDMTPIVRNAPDALKPFTRSSPSGLPEPIQKDWMDWMRTPQGYKYDQGQSNDSTRVLVPQAQITGAPQPPARPGDLFAPGQTAPTPTPAPAPDMSPADNPLVVRGIRPQTPQPAPQMEAPKQWPTPPRRPDFDFIQPTSQAQPQGSTPTMWGANYHGPEASMVNRMQGSTPDYTKGIQEWRSPQGWMNGDPNVRPPQTQFPSPTPTQFDPLTGQNVANNTGSGFMGFLGSIFG